DIRPPVPPVRCRRRDRRRRNGADADHCDHEAHAGTLCRGTASLPPATNQPPAADHRPLTMTPLVRFFRFNAVGALGVAVQLASLWLLTGVAAVHYLIATPLAVSLAIVHNFVWHRL